MKTTRKGFLATLVGLLGISTVKGNKEKWDVNKLYFYRKYPLTPDQCIMPGTPEWQAKHKELKQTTR